MSNNAAKKICKIIPYYGTWPEYINIYFDSVKRNPIIDIIIITDLPPLPNAPQNVKFIDISFGTLKQKIADLFQIDTSNFFPYKLCDIRPAYGIIFNEYIKEYDFWGYGDLDLLYGDLSSFLTPEILNKYDLITFQAKHLHGPFTLYKNTEFINNLFKRCKNYREIFQDKNYLSFDEFGSQHFHVAPFKKIAELENDTISIIALKAEENNEIKFYHQLDCIEMIYKTGDMLVYDHGKLYNYKTKKEYSFYHWVLEKRAVWFKYPDWKTNVPQKYFISDSGFYTEKEFANFRSINLSRKAQGFIKWLSLKSFNYLKRKIGLKVKVDTYAKPGFIKHL